MRRGAGRALEGSHIAATVWIEKPLAVLRDGRQGMSIGGEGEMKKSWAIADMRLACG